MGLTLDEIHDTGMDIDVVEPPWKRLHLHNHKRFWGNGMREIKKKWEHFADGTTGVYCRKCNKLWLKRR